MADGDYISTKNDVEKVFGKDNIRRWADADNRQNLTVINERIDWANEYAEQEMLGRLANGPYDISDIRTTKPKAAIYISACIAGIYLYDTRRVVESENNTDRVASQRKHADRMLSQILSGRFTLLDPTTYAKLSKTAQNSPSIATDDDIVLEDP